MQYIDTICALCETKYNSQEVFGARLDSLSASTEIFSARRLPDRRYYRWVRCNSCDLYRSDPILNINLAELYKNSTFDYGSEILGLKATYAKLVGSALLPERPSGHLLEVGGGNGFFLEQALEMGFDSVSGVEPSQQAVDSALPHIRKTMKVSMFNNSSAENNSTNVITLFHTLDHLEDPMGVLKTAFQKLKSNGKILVAVHNVDSFSSKLLRSKSPIFDVEHTYLFSKKTLRLALEKSGFQDVTVSAYTNLYSLSYIFHLLPFPRPIKLMVLNSRFNNVLKRIKVWIPLGNIYAYGRKRN